MISKESSNIIEFWLRNSAKIQHYRFFLFEDQLTLMVWYENDFKKKLDQNDYQDLIDIFIQLINANFRKILRRKRSKGAIEFA